MTAEHKAGCQPIRIEATAAGYGSRIFLDGKEVRYVRHASIDIGSNGQLTVLKLEIIAMNGVEVNGFAETMATVTHIGDQPDGTFIPAAAPRDFADGGIVPQKGPFAEPY